MIVVADSGPLIALSAIGRLDLLRALYAAVVVPRAVWDEVVIGGDGEPGSAEVRVAMWIEVVEAPKEPLLAALLGEMDRVEAEALAIAADHGADLVLVDDRRGRRAAIRIGLVARGTFGVLLDARRAGLIEAVVPLVKELQASGLHATPALVTEIARRAGEQLE